MKTKEIIELHDILDSKGIDIHSDFAYVECVKPWVRWVLSTPAELHKVWIDCLCDIKADSEDFIDFVRFLATAESDFEVISSKGSHVPTKLKSTAVWGNSLQRNQQYMGCFMQDELRTRVEKYVEENAEYWLAMVCDYADELAESAA